MESTKTSHVLVLYTGGTIGMVKTGTGSLAPSPNQLPKLLRRHPVLHDQKHVSTFGESLGESNNHPFILPAVVDGNKIAYWIDEYEPLLDSSNMTIKEWLKIANDIKSSYELFDGFVILHGTDTLTYTAAALSFMLQNLGKTVIITGSQVPIFELRSDGIDNFVSSLILAGNYVIPEVCVCFGNKLLRGNRTVKISTESFHAFDSPNAASLAKLGINIEVFYERIFRPTTIEKFSVHCDLNSHVGLLRIFPSITSFTVDAFLQPPIEGVVLQTYGSGNISSNRTDILNSLAEAHLRGVILVNCTQCLHGGVDDIYETQLALTKIGVLPGFDMTPEAALTKLSYVLSKSEWDLNTKKKMMRSNMRGELTNRSLTDYNTIRLFKNSLSKREMRGEDGEYIQRVLLPAAMCDAASKDDMEKIQYWESVGGDLSATNADLTTPLHAAAREGHLRIVKYALSRGASVHAKDRYGNTPLDDAILFNRFDVILLLVKCGAHLRMNQPSKWVESMCRSASSDNQNMLKAFYLAGADFNVQDCYGRTPLHYAVANNRVNCITYLLDNGASPQLKDNMNQTSIDVAHSMSLSNIVKILTKDD